jgi:hypothetical protein
MAKRTREGGGYGSRPHVEMKKWKQEPKSHAVSPASVNQMGVSTQFKKEPLVSGPGYTTKPEGPTGIANARKGPSGAGPGGMGRTIYSSGSQCKTPPANPLPPGRKII